MTRYAVQHNYRTQTLGPWKEGEEVELTEEIAEQVNRDSPGALTEVKAAKAVKAAKKTTTSPQTGRAG